MNFRQLSDNPFQLLISFHKMIEHYEQLAAQNEGLRSKMAKELLEKIRPYPELRNGITSISTLEKHTSLISDLLAEVFTPILTKNEIKAVTIPYQELVFNQTDRFKQILNDAGPDFNINIRDFSDHQFYVMSCCLILNKFYGTNFDFTKPLFYDIPAATGIVRHYRILYNADFIEIIPTAKAIKITRADIELLRDNFDDLDLWKQKFPPGSWILKGFGVMNLFDASIENAVSVLKETLLHPSNPKDVHESLEMVFKTIYNIPDMRMGFSSYNIENRKLSSAIFAKFTKSFIVPQGGDVKSLEVLCKDSFVSIIEQKSYFAVSDLEEYGRQNPNSDLAQHLLAQEIKSFILAPVVANDQLIGVLELVSYRAGELNSINANRLDIVMPFLADTIDRRISEFQNRIQALIQTEYTTIHPSVYWKFKQEAITAIQQGYDKKAYKPKEITFADVYPLYGQIDIKGSSETRNRSVQLDLQTQLANLLSITAQLDHSGSISIPQQNIQELKLLEAELSMSLKADTEQYIQQYIDVHIHPFLHKAIHATDQPHAAIKDYFSQLNRQTGSFHYNRRKYDTTVSTINEKMTTILDKWQEEAQLSFPHYFERFKTDGVEHNLYIGASIAPNRNFKLSYLYNLRLWQLQVMCQMELEHHFQKETLPYPLEVTSLILASGAPLSIRFRMDEKRFDVDGTYNARFEIVKKRIDKACIKGTTARIAAVGCITIVYSNVAEEEEYKSYIAFLQRKNMLAKDIEMLEVEDLQGISGLKALRVKIMYNSSLPVQNCYNFVELLSDEYPEALMN